MYMTTQRGWQHDDSRFQWELRNERGQVVATLTDEVCRPLWDDSFNELTLDPMRTPLYTSSPRPWQLLSFPPAPTLRQEFKARVAAKFGCALPEDAEGIYRHARSS